LKVINRESRFRGRAAVMAKIEKPQAIDRLAEILEVADALMVARGDLGVELRLERVPSLQKQMARRAGEPVVVATQMLESMIQSPVATRAEVSDVATAVYEGADAIMLSAESAAGKFPVEAVSTMNRIGEEVERDPTYREVITAQRPPPEATAGDAIADAARRLSSTSCRLDENRQRSKLRRCDVGSGMRLFRRRHRRRRRHAQSDFGPGCSSLALNGAPRSGQEICIGNYYRRAANECRQGLFLR
jgi:hypothetical protein